MVAFCALLSIEDTILNRGCSRQRRQIKRENRFLEIARPPIEDVLKEGLTLTSIVLEF